MWGVSLRDRNRSEVLLSLLVAEVLRHCRLRWFGHLERYCVDDWESSCRNVEVAREKCRGRGRGRGRKTWRECVHVDMKLLGLQPGLVETGWFANMKHETGWFAT